MVDLLFFAELQESVGKEKISVEAAGMTVQELKNTYLRKYDIQNTENVMVAINEEYVTDNSILVDGDVVAFIPPVSGG
ncbi:MULTISPECIES: molybdopterin converting factor subunit 1 [unclassified Virgibacillus]|uniref:molybdopterin converting factor subunit 1 n=1 Tax=unclassified Virgibacillus TaxID=2620237 RepID=UPI0024DE04E3|nr:molybdopterin converting factor subunit 1 [Virgibacillus sp. LDC-1]